MTEVTHLLHTISTSSRPGSSLHQGEARRISASTSHSKPVLSSTIMLASVSILLSAARDVLRNTGQSIWDLVAAPYGQDVCREKQKLVILGSGWGGYSLSKDIDKKLWGERLETLSSGILNTFEKQTASVTEALNVIPQTSLSSPHSPISTLRRCSQGELFESYGKPA